MNHSKALIDEAIELVLDDTWATSGLILAPRVRRSTNGS
jgi:hypothetical protein